MRKSEINPDLSGTGIENLFDKNIQHEKPEKNWQEVTEEEWLSLPKDKRKQIGDSLHRMIERRLNSITKPEENEVEMSDRELDKISDKFRNFQKKIDSGDIEARLKQEIIAATFRFFNLQLHKAKDPKSFLERIKTEFKSDISRILKLIARDGSPGEEGGGDRSHRKITAAETAMTQKQEKSTSFFEEEAKSEKMGKKREVLEEESSESRLKKELKESLHKLHLEVTKREGQGKNIKLEDKELESHKLKIAKQLTSENYSRTLLDWFKKPGQSQDHEVILELINEIWDKNEPKEEFTMRLGREKRAWLQRRLEEMMEAESKK